MQAHRKIIHVDMDAYFAAVEQLDRPELRGKPVIVGGDPHSRGVVATCSYEARRYGIHSAMAASRAARLCPQAIFVRPRFDRYREITAVIRTLFHEYTDLVEPLSLDEAYLDVTANKKGIASATWVAREILERIRRETGLTASAGVSFNKFLAKIASDVNKPAGLTVVTPEQAHAFIDALPVRKFFGIGKVTEERMVKMGIHTGADLKKVSLEDLATHFGKAGRYYYHIARGIDTRPVVASRERKSLGKETTLEQDLRCKHQMGQVLEALARRLEQLLAQRSLGALTLTLKVKYGDFQQVTRSLTRPAPLKAGEEIYRLASALLADTEAGARPVRLLGISLSNLQDKNLEASGQLPLPFSA